MYCQNQEKSVYVKDFKSGPTWLPAAVVQPTSTPAVQAQLKTEKLKNGSLCNGHASNVRNDDEDITEAQKPCETGNAWPMTQRFDAEAVKCAQSKLPLLQGQCWFSNSLTVNEVKKATRPFLSTGRKGMWRVFNHARRVAQKVPS